MLTRSSAETAAVRLLGALAKALSGALLLGFWPHNHPQVELGVFANALTCIAGKLCIPPAPLSFHQRPLFARRQRSNLVARNNPESLREQVVEEYAIPLDSQAPPSLTIVIPAYNEEKRLPQTLQQIQTHFSGDSTEFPLSPTRIVVVDDGSKDSTAEAARCSSLHQIPVTCLRLPENTGKGGALAAGVQYAVELQRSDRNELTTSPALILTMDADGSADLSGVSGMYETLHQLLLQQIIPSQSGNIQENEKGCEDPIRCVWSSPAVVNGYRTYSSASPSRFIFRWGFRLVVRLLFGWGRYGSRGLRRSYRLGVRDSQCGFKLMTTSAGEALYRNLNLLGWSHDVEVFYRALLLQIPVAECAIEWTDQPGSKLVATPGGVMVVAMRMLLDVVKLKWQYGIGRWSVYE
jgi:dolichyl-phosphate beta-glucosyltransferase